MAKETSSLSLSDVYKKENRRRRRIILGVVFLVVYGVFLGGTWLVVRSPLFRIQNVEISGNKNVSSNDILTLVSRRISNDSFWKRTLGLQNILVWPKNFSSDDLRIIPELKGLSIKKDYEKRNVAITVEERQPLAVWCSFAAQTRGTADGAVSGNTAADSLLNGNSSGLPVNQEEPCWWFDNGGVLFARALKVEGNLITVVDDYSQKNLGLGSNILPTEFIPNVFSVFKAVSDADLSVKEIRLNDINLQELEVDTYTGSPGGALAKAGPKIYFSLRFPADNTLAVIQSLEKQPGFDKLQYLDFRVENRAYYK